MTANHGWGLVAAFRRTAKPPPATTSQQHRGYTTITHRVSDNSTGETNPNANT